MSDLFGGTESLVCLEKDEAGVSLLNGKFGDEAKEILKILTETEGLEKHDKKHKEEAIKKMIEIVNDTHRNKFFCLDDFCKDNEMNCIRCFVNYLINVLNHYKEV